MRHRSVEEHLRSVRPHPEDDTLWHRAPEADQVDPAVLGALLRRIAIVSSTLGSATSTCWKRRSNAGSFSMRSRY
ncbi:hypothetical protein AB0I50_25045, partial [Streptomyces prunicolor]